MHVKNIALIVVFPVIMSGCYSYRIYPKAIRDFKPPEATETVYIVNPGLKKEFNILKNAGIFTVTNDSTGSTKIRLIPMDNRLICGNAFPVWIFLLGQLPMFLPDKYIYSFEKIDGNESKKVEYNLRVGKRYWFWDIFSNKKDFNKEAGKSLAAHYYGYNEVATLHQ